MTMTRLPMPTSYFNSIENSPIRATRVLALKGDWPIVNIHAKVILGGGVFY
jgi:hypothetical protein